MQSNKDHDDFSDRKFRETLNITIINNFLDFQQTSNFTTLSSFFHHMRNSFKEIPHIFVSNFQPESNEDHLQQNNDSNLSAAFTEWLIMWLVQVLHHECAHSVHQECEDLLLSLLSLVRAYNPANFRHYISCFIQMLNVLNDFVDEFEEKGVGNFTLKNYFQKDKVYLSEDKELVLVDISISFSNPDECESLQRKISLILGNLVEDISLFLPDLINNLCHIFCLQIELGDLSLKQVSLKALSSLVAVNVGLISCRKINYMFDCLQAVICFCSTCDNQNSESIELQLAAATCVQEINKNINQLESKFLINSYVWGKFLHNLLEVVTKNSFYSCDKVFQESIISSIISFMKYGSENQFSILLETLLNFIDQLSYFLFDLKDSKILTPLFVYLISFENTHFQSFMSYFNMKPNVSDAVPKQIISDSPVQNLSFLKMKEYNRIWCKLYDLLCSQLDSEKSKNKLRIESLSNILTILVQTFCEVVSSARTIKYDLLPLVKGVPSIKSNVPENFMQAFNNLVLAKVSDACASTTYIEIVLLFKLLLSVQDIIYLTTEQLIFINNIISIPFVKNWTSSEFFDLECLDISIDVMKEMPATLNVSDMMESLSLFPLLPDNLYPKWKHQVLLFCISNQDEKLQSAAVKLLPFFLFYQTVPLQTFPGLVECMLNSKSVEVLTQVASIFGKINCILAGTASIFRNLNGADEKTLTLMPDIECTLCNKNNKVAALISGSSSFGICLKELFLYLINYPSEVVRKELISSIIPFFTHNKIPENLVESFMQLLIDPDLSVRYKFGDIISDIVKLTACMDKDSHWQQKVDEILILKLKSALMMSKCPGNASFQRTVVHSIGEISKVAEGGLLLITVISLLESYMTSISSIKVVAFSKLKEVAEAKNLKMQDLFKGFKDPICKFVAEFLSSPQDVNDVLVVFKEIGIVFGFNDLKSFVHQAQRFILPYIVSKEEEPSAILLESLSTVLQIDKSDLLINNFPYIFSHFVRHCTKNELEKALLLIQKCTNLELGSLLRCNYQLIHNELLLHLSTHYEQVFSGLAILALKSGNLQDSGSRITHTEEMANYLQPKLLGFLVFFDAQMLKSSMDEKKLALESLVSIMKLMGSRAVTAVRFKLMATLRIALRFKEGSFPKICCKAWSTFVDCIELTYLGPLLNQIVVALLPLLELEPASVAAIFEYLIIKNRSYLNEYFHDLYFMPETTELHNINMVLKEYNESPSSITDFQSLLFHSLKGISHENLEVRLHALEKLKQVLHTNQKAIYDHLLGRESVDSLLSNLVAALIDGCRESDLRVRVALGECLGELGAIDPGRLNTNDASSIESLASFYSSIDNEDFAFALIQELVHSFLAADECGIQDCSACAIQEVLRFYKCSNEKGSSGNCLWKRFPPDIQEILAVLFHSQYKPLARSRKKFPSPIYQSRIGSTYKDWTKNWFCSLLQKVKKENPLKLFHSCSIIVKYDLNCTLFLLPHLVVYALLDSTDSERNEICAEILAVLNHSMASTSTSDLLHLSSQTVFSVFDHLTKWSHNRQQEIISSIVSRSIGSKKEPDKNLQIIKSCLNKIPQILLAESSFACKAYTRSLMHLEQHLKVHSEELENNISFLQKIYSALDEADGVAGVAAVRKEEATLNDLILENEAIGDMQGAFACYEKAIKQYPNEVNYYGGLIKCLMGMDQPSTAISYANGVLSEKPEWKSKLNQFRVEAAWKLANWQDLETFLKDEAKETEWAVGVGNILYLANKKDVDGMEKLTKVIRSNQMAPLSAASMEKGSYLRGYEHLTHIHLLTDLQLCINVIFDLKSNDDTEDMSCGQMIFNEILPTLNIRRQLVQSSPRYQEPIYDLHRVLMKIGKENFPSYLDEFNKEIASCWLQSAKLARKSGFHQRAYSCLLEAGIAKTADFFMEKIKWLWSKGEKEQAIYCLHKGIEEHFSARVLETSSNLQLMYAKAKLLLALYSEETSIVDSSTLINMYKEVVTLEPVWEASHFHLAKYYDKVLNSCDEPAARAEIMVNVVQSFTLSLKHGCKNVYHSLPRLLDIWFDLGTLLTQDIHTLSRKYPNSWKTMSSSLQQITETIVQDVFEHVPLYLFLTAFPQMISRICHSHPSISLHLQKFISKILASYSQQAMWMMIAVSKSSYPTRIKRCKLIFQEATLLNPSLGKFIGDTTRLADKLIELSNKNVGECNNMNLSEKFPSLLKLIEEKNFSQIILPTQNQMIVTLPTGFSCNKDHDAFPFNPVYIKSFANTVDVFSSLQKPKKLIVIGSDGKHYPVMCKPKDDLRKDCRLMEFNNLVNRYLKSDPEARRRQLYIRTYTVIPLNEECGLIEWVPSLCGLRNILSKLYKMKGLFVSGREIRAMMPPKTASFEQKLMIFKTKFLPKFPPVFHDWFLITFPDPTAWYFARLAYARTTAVMSMVGYIVGLGDRHGENILFDSSCGDIVHVDLNCLFNKGESMECPEVVPFRLTHNMVQAMGPTGYEGAFRKACEVTMRVMRSRTDALMSVLRPFVHDPLLEWSRNKNAKTQQSESGEITNEQALTHVKDIELRLNGIIKTKRKQQGLPLSIEGQVNHLIQEAVDIKNLSQMYIGWAAYM